MRERWLRWYDGTVRDGKFRIVAELSNLPVCTIIGIWASLLEDASMNNPRGVSCRGAEYHSMFLGLTADEIVTVWNALERVGVVKITDGTVVIVRWNKCQFETDANDPTAKVRKSKWKSKQKQSHKNNNGTKRNNKERSGTPESKSETETESETYKKKKKKILDEEYVFESGIIKLNRSDFDNWKRAFSSLDLRAELLSLTQWANDQGNRWFFAVSSALAKRNREQKVKLQQAKIGAPQLARPGIL